MPSDFCLARTNTIAINITINITMHLFIDRKKVLLDGSRPRGWRMMVVAGRIGHCSTLFNRLYYCLAILLAICAGTIAAEVLTTKPTPFPFLSFFQQIRLMFPQHLRMDT